MNKKVHHIENGLVEFTTPLGMFQPPDTDLRDRRTLFERMAHYKVPGVSIAVICERVQSS